jgi:hypothetical protein
VGVILGKGFYTNTGVVIDRTMKFGKYNKDAPPDEYRYEITTDGMAVKATRSDEDLVIGQLPELLEFIGETRKDEMGVEIDVATVLEHITLPRAFGDRIRDIPKRQQRGDEFRERVCVFGALFEVYMRHGFERRAGDNLL